MQEYIILLEENEKLKKQISMMEQLISAGELEKILDEHKRLKNMYEIISGATDAYKEGK